MFSALVTPPSNALWGKLSVRRGRNTWRLCVARKFQPSTRALEVAATATAKMLSLVQPSTSFWYPYWGSWSPKAIAAGEARPIIPVEVAFGDTTKAMGLPAGELLGIRTMALPFPEDATPAGVSLAFPTGGYPCWWAFVDFWWRGEDVTFPRWPYVGAGTNWTGTGDPIEQDAVLDVAVKPSDEMDPGDKTLIEIAEATGRDIVEHTVEDWDKTVAAVGRFGASRGAAFLLGGLVAVGGLLWLRGARR